MCERLFVANAHTKAVKPIEETSLKERKGAELTNEKGERVRVFESEDTASAWVGYFDKSGARLADVPPW